jgi:hypothetical protein
MLTAGEHRRRATRHKEGASMWIRNRKPIALGAGAALVLLLAAAGLSRPVRRSAQKLFAAVTGSSPSHTDPASLDGTVAVASPDVGQRALTHHGWTAAILDSVAKGSITWYDRSGAITRQGTLVIYRKFPDLLRVEITANQTTEVSGFDATNPWRSGQASLADAAARDIRQWLRCSPERLFVTRELGVGYREPGRRVEDHIPPTPWQGAVDLALAREYDQAELIDLIGPATLTTGAVDRRRVTYLVDRQTSLIAAARWLEPADPKQSADSPTTRLVETRVDFSQWRDVAGVQWPYAITHWSGGRVDFQVKLTQVLLNQPLQDNLFQTP